MDWNIGIKRIEGAVNADGFFTLDRKLRPAGELYKTLARQNAGSPLVYGLPGGLINP